MRRGKNVAIASEYLNKAILFIDSEKELLDNKTKYPQSFLKKQLPAIPKLYWSDKRTKRDLQELLSALFHSGAVEDEVGKKCPYITLIRVFEIIFNIKLPKNYTEKDLLAIRTNKSTFFLDFLKEKFLKQFESKNRQK